MRQNGPEKRNAARLDGLTQIVQLRSENRVLRATLEDILEGWLDDLELHDNSTCGGGTTHMRLQAARAVLASRPG